MKIELTTKSLFVIAVILLIPTSIAFGLKITGTDFNDIIVGTSERDEIDGKKGSDMIFGFGNDDGATPLAKMEKLKGGEGDDELVGDQDPLGLVTAPLGTAGDDKLEGQKGNDFVVGDAGNDIMKESKGGRDIMFGSAGDDTMDGGNDQDKMYGMAGDDTMKGGSGNDVMFGNWGNDDISGGGGKDFIDCGEDPDGLDEDIARIRLGDNDIVVNCETILDEKTGEPIGAGVCGDGTLNVGETCDDANLTNEDGCSEFCLLEVCGDGILQPLLGEACDDGNNKNNDGCNSICQAEFCGDGVKQSGEACDDGNNVDGDGCSAACVIEPSECGNNVVEAPETCDDANLTNEDGCSEFCLLEVCGDGILQPLLGEACDDGGTVDGDGCDAACVIEFCGDGAVNDAPNEACDDGNNVDGDGCSAVCIIEGLTTCGNDVVEAPETCDDGGTVDGDGCSAVCTVEDGFMLSANAAFAPSLLGPPFEISLGGSLFLKLTSDDDIDFDNIKKTEFEIKVDKVKVKGTLTQGPDGVFTIEVMSSVLNSVFFDGDSGLVKLKVEDTSKKKLEFKNILVSFVS